MNMHFMIIFRDGNIHLDSLGGRNLARAKTKTRPPHKLLGEHRRSDKRGKNFLPFRSAVVPRRTLYYRRSARKAVQ